MKTEVKQTETIHLRTLPVYSNRKEECCMFTAQVCRRMRVQKCGVWDWATRIALNKVTTMMMQ